MIGKLGDVVNWTALITGFQAQDTLRRKLVERMREVRVCGEPEGVDFAGTVEQARRSGRV